MTYVTKEQDSYYEITLSTNLEKMIKTVFIVFSYHAYITYTFVILISGDRILNGESKLSLTTQSLSLLNVSFRRYSDAKNNEPSRNRSHRDQMEKWKFNVQYLHDFITKTISLKVIQCIHSDCSVCSLYVFCRTNFILI